MCCTQSAPGTVAQWVPGHLSIRLINDIIRALQSTCFHAYFHLCKFLSPRRYENSYPNYSHICEGMETHIYQHQFKKRIALDLDGNY